MAHGTQGLGPHFYPPAESCYAIHLPRGPGTTPRAPGTQRSGFMTQTMHDVIVLGSGPAGGIVARTCADAGLDVVVVERDGWGGVCPLRGCEPKKVLVDAAHAVVRVHDARGKGVAGEARLDWPELMRFKRTLIDPIPEAVRGSFTRRGSRTVAGDARLDEHGDVVVPGHGVLRARHVVLAVGARPRPLGVPGEDLLMTSADFLQLDAMPESLVFIGGGFVSFEFAGVAEAAGARAMVLHRSERVLKGFDPDLSATLVEGMRARGVEVVTGTPGDERGTHARGRSRVGANARRGPNGDSRPPPPSWARGACPIQTPWTWTRPGSRFRGAESWWTPSCRASPTPRVLAVGDCADPGAPLTPVAVLQAATAARTIIHGPGAPSNLGGTASVVFSHPPLCAVGLSEEQARERGPAFDTLSGNAAKWSEHKRLGIGHAGYKILVEQGSGRILGAHYLGQHAEEVANIFGLAVRHGLTRDDLMNQPWAYPSFGYALRYMLG